MLSGVGFQVSAPPPVKNAASLIAKETNEHRTSNVQHRTSNNEFCLLLKRLSDVSGRSRRWSLKRFRPSTFDIRYSAVLRFAF